jgi:valacyclovir hydrolase
MPGRLRCITSRLERTIGARRMLCTPTLGASGTLRVRGVDLFYIKNGRETEMPLLCMPGAMGTAETDFAPQLTGLSDTTQVISFDPRGYGRSRPPAREFPIDFYQQDADDAAALMKALGHERYALMGWSDGAISAVMHAASHPAAVAKLIIFGGNAYLTKKDIDAFEATRNVEATWSRRQKETHYPIYGAEGLQKMWGSACDAWAAIYEHSQGDVCMRQAKSITCPTMVLHGAKDPICLPEHAEWFKANIPGDGATSLHVLPEGKHNLHIRFADEVNGLVRDFLKR